MVITNPTSIEIKVQIEGVNYVLPANGELIGVKEEHALYWKEKLHNFIAIKVESKKDLAAEVAEVIAEKGEKKVTKK